MVGRHKLIPKSKVIKRGEDMSTSKPRAGAVIPGLSKRGATILGVYAANIIRLCPSCNWPCLLWALVTCLYKSQHSQNGIHFLEQIMNNTSSGNSGDSFLGLYPLPASSIGMKGQ